MGSIPIFQKYYVVGASCSLDIRRTARCPHYKLKHLGCSRFNVRVGSQLHRQAALFAQQRGMNLNKLVTDALERYLKGESLENA